MSFLLDNMAAIMVAATVATIGWIYGGTRGDLLNPVLPWLTVLMLEIGIAYPQRHRGETMYDARDRVWSAMRGDPLVWTSLVLILILAVPFFNKALCVNCDAGLIAAGADSAPPIPFLPFCVNRFEHLNVFLWFAAALSAAIVVRHSLTQSGKRLTLAIIVWNGLALAALGFLQHAIDAPGPLWNGETGLPHVRGIQKGMADFFSTFGYANMAGCYFTLLFGLAVALWRDTTRRAQLEYEMKDISNAADKPRLSFWKAHYHLIPAAVFFYAALYSMSRSAIFFASSCATIYIIHTFITHLSRLDTKLEKVRTFVVGILGICVLVFAATVFIPQKAVREIGSLNTIETLDRVSGRTDGMKRAATEIWQDNMLFGCGGWGFKHFSTQKLPPARLPIVGGINVHNDYLQFLAEHGVVGFGLLVAAIVMLFWPVGRAWRELIKRTRFMKKRDLPAKPVAIFVLPAPVFCILVAEICALIHAFGDCPFRSPAIMTLFFVSLAAMQGFMPKSRQ